MGLCCDGRYEGGALGSMGSSVILWLFNLIVASERDSGWPVRGIGPWRMSQKCSAIWRSVATESGSTSPGGHAS